METRKKLAVEAWKSGLNCAQAVLVTYADLLNIDKETIYPINIFRINQNMFPCFCCTFA